jgi:hypothetical protein
MKSYDAPDPNIYWETWAPRGNDIEAHWQALNALDPKEQAEAVCNRVDNEGFKPACSPVRGVHWRVVLPHLPFAKEIKDKFWKEFSEPGAIHNRKTALRGLVLTRLERALAVVEEAGRAYEPVKRTLGSGEESVRLYIEALKEFREAHASLGEWFAGRLDAGDHQIFEMIVKILKDGVDPATDAKGGPDSADGKVLQIFVDLHVTGRTLPTKREILEKYVQARGCSPSECDLTQRQMFSKQVSKSLKKLGLAGLPS